MHEIMSTSENRRERPQLWPRSAAVREVQRASQAKEATRSRFFDVIDGRLVNKTIHYKAERHTRGAAMLSFRFPLLP
jgi:hypothetical protein